jgi:molybdate transport system ATP-binding protein
MTLSVDVRAHRDGFVVEAAIEARPDETLALLGPNGSGKSTLVDVIAGLLPPDAGALRLDDRILDEPASGIHVPPEARPIGMVFQDLMLFPHLDAVDNVAFPLRAARVPAREARARAAELLERLGVSDRAHAQSGRLSGGEAQRVALARALVARPRVLLLDEPMSALDVSARNRIRELVRRELAAFSGIRLLVTHDPVEAMTMADRIAVLENGRITQVGSPDDLRRTPRTPYAADLVGVNAFAGRLEPLDDGTGRVVTTVGEVIVAWPDGVDRSASMDGVIALLRPSEVSLHRRRPEGSPRNVLHGRVVGIEPVGERVRVRLDTSPPVVAELTRGSLERLELAEGVETWATFKAVEVSVLLPS